MSEKVLEVISKAIVIYELLRSEYQQLAPALKAVDKLIETYRTQGTVTDEQLAEVEKLLDEQLTEFNEPLPEG